MSTVELDKKSASLIAKLDMDRPELAGVGDAKAFVQFLSDPTRTRPRYSVEYDRKSEMLAFLSEHYPNWREFDVAPAEKIAALTADEATGPRITGAARALGLAWWAKGEEHWGEAFGNLYTRVPTGGMFNWGSFNGSQPTSELMAWFLLQDNPAFTTEMRIAFLDHLHSITDSAWDDHTSQWGHDSLGPEGHNWYLHGMHCLIHVGLLFPEFKRSEFFARTGWSVVEEHVRGHHRADGGAREACLGYQAGSTQCLWDMYTMAVRNGVPMSQGFAQKLLHQTKYLLRLASPVGGLPSFGDGGHAPGALTAIAAIAAALTGDGECKWYAERFRCHFPAGEGETAGILPSCAFWAVGLAGAATYAETRAQDPHHVSILHGASGYAALRQDDGDTAPYLGIAAANRGPVVTSHGHNDVFALDVHAGGVRFLGEAGCAPYGISPGRDYDQSTQAHNCLALDDMEQAELRGEWRWARNVIPCVPRWITEPTHDFFHGVHEGFYHYPERLAHHARKVVFIKGDPAMWVIFDHLNTNEELPVSVWWHGLVPGEVEGDRIVLRDESGATLVVAPPAGDGLTPERTTNAGLEAYFSERKLDAEQHPCFAYHKACNSDCLVWLITPETGDARSEIRRLPVTLNGADAGAELATAVEIQQGDVTTQVCVSHADYDAELSFADKTVWGCVAISRNGPEPLDILHRMEDGIVGR